MKAKLQMDEKQAKRLGVIEQVKQGVLTQAQAAGQLSLSVRQIKRMYKAYKAQGAAGLIHRARGRTSNCGVEQASKQRWLAQVRERYSDFGPTLAAEQLRAQGFTHSVGALRQWMIADGLWHARTPAKQTAHLLRQRRPQLGELIQIDGSPHRWLEQRGPACCLIAFIDDATSRLMAAHFCAHENTWGYLHALQSYVTAHGRPLALYSDRHGIFTQHKALGKAGQPLAPTQFERALLQLDIESILALSPQAKGRVERLFQTLQDRLVKALRLANICTLEAANAYLVQYLPAHNARFAVAPASAQDAHRPYSGSPQELSRICALHHQRSVNAAQVVQFETQVLVLRGQHASSSKSSRKSVNIVQYADDRLELFIGATAVQFDRHDWLQTQTRRRADAKQINAQLDDLAAQVQAKEIRRLGRLHNQIAAHNSLRANAYQGAPAC
jgi:hypothetical protein